MTRPVEASRAGTILRRTSAKTREQARGNGAELREEARESRSIAYIATADAFWT